MRMLPQTRITQLLGIEVPIFQAGMSWASSSAALPARVSELGGLGVIAAGPMRPHDLAETIDNVRARTKNPFAVNVPLYGPRVDEILDVIESKGVAVLIASQGGTARYLDRFQSRGTTCLHVVASEYHAVKAAKSGVDGLIVVGGEAGGHPPPDLVSTMVIVRAVARTVPETPIVASGGIADGHGVAAALCLGADAAQLGTRFACSFEASLHDVYKDEIVRASVESTVVVGQEFGPVRVLRNSFAERMLEPSLSHAERDQTFKNATLKDAARLGDVLAGKVEMGQSAGLIDSVESAEEIMKRIVDEYRWSVARLIPETSESMSGLATLVGRRDE